MALLPELNLIVGWNNGLEVAEKLLPGIEPRFNVTNHMAV